MVLSRNDKRKKREGDLVDLMDPLAESPKRTKVHAQRKFAQGATTMFSASPTLVKDKEKAKPAKITELITHKRPNTEDFLTFLCFRGNPILPANLNFFNVGNKREREKPEPKTLQEDKVSSSGGGISTELQKQDTGQKSVTKVKPVVPDKKKIPNTIHKSITNKLKAVTSTTVQALKKKYQEQRLAKQRNKFKATCVMRTRSCTERALLSQAGIQLTPRKFLPGIKAKRHGLRSSVLPARTGKSLPKVAKIAPPSKPKKKGLNLRPRSSDTSEVSSSEEEEEDDDEEEEEEEDEGKGEKKDDEEERDEDDKKDRSDHKGELAAELDKLQIKRTVHKVARKKICTRSKSEMRRVTRSCSSTVSTQNLPRRPTRKTKEAAAVYMELLGRKLVSPDLENDDNDSVGSFPELPSARRITQTENEVRAKVKQTPPTRATISKNKEPKASSLNKRLDQSKSKLILRSKRLMRVSRRYREEDSDAEESESSVETTNRPITRQSKLGKADKPISRSLRSSSRNIAAEAVQSNASTKPRARQSGVKVALKRKYVAKSSSDKKAGESRQKGAKGARKSEHTESEEEEGEETLGMLLKKIKRKREDEEEERIAENEARDDGDETAVRKRAKVSDDEEEESFRGFTKKAISRGLHSCHAHVDVPCTAGDETETMAENQKMVATPRAKAKEESRAREEERGLPDETEGGCGAIAPDEKSMTNPPYVGSASEQTPVNKEPCEQENNGTSSRLVVNMPLSIPRARKERVNMSTEQIEKWLNESSLAKEESKLEMENVSAYRFEQPSAERLRDVSHLSISSKIQHLVRPVNVTLLKLPPQQDRGSAREQQRSAGANTHGVPADDARNHPEARAGEGAIVVKSKTEPARNNKLLSCEKQPIKDSISLASAEDTNEDTKSDLNSVDGSTVAAEKKTSPEKKIFQPRRPFLPKVRERKAATPNVNAFSPENESSVYAFESDAEVPVSTPFRRKSKETAKDPSSAPAEPAKLVVAKDEETSPDGSKPPDDASCHEEKRGQRDDVTTPARSQGSKFELPKHLANFTTVQVLPLDKLTTSWSNVNCSASIAVQVNLDGTARECSESNECAANPAQKSTEISTQTETPNNENDDENDGQLFYIPLQPIRSGPNLVQGQQLIQGVAVKLTEGPTGPNQRVLLHAKLVTKPPLSIARCPPIGTVQPTTRPPPNPPVAITVEQQAASTSTTVSTSVASMPAEAQQPASSVKSDAPPNRPDVGTSMPSAGSVLEKLAKSPKSARERKTSIDSAKSGKRTQVKQSKQKGHPCGNSTFPSVETLDDEARVVEAPTFHPTEKDFQDPLEYIDKIRSVAEKFGICKVVPPSNFKPECKVSDDMRFTAYNQYVHRMLHRWGPNVKEMMAIKKYLATQSITLTQPPWIGGMEVDLPHLYQTVQSLGGLKEVIEKKKWQKVADGMKIPKSAQDRVTKLDDIYCKYLLPYDTLSPEERGKLFDEVEAEWLKKKKKALERQQTPINDNDEDDEDDSSDEIEECIVKGRNMPLNAFYRIARNTQRMWFGENQRGNEAEGASADEVESAFWKHVAERKRHICVHAASIDSSGRGFGFSVAKNSPFARHSWNLKVLTNNAGSVLRALGPLMGVTIPTLHVGMLFSACCWYRDPHGLPWIEYLHTGAKKIWYGIPDKHNNSFREALTKMVPQYCKNKTIWLSSDTAMVPPELLVSNGVPLCRTVQEPGQFIIVFPKAFTSSICTGYVVSESVYFAQPSWLETAEQVFKDIQDSCEPSIFSFERLLFNIVHDTRSHVDILKQILPSVMRVRLKELDYRKQLTNAGLTKRERLPLPSSGKGKRGKKVKEDDGDFECESCRANLFVSLVNNSQDDSVYCLPHGLQLINRKKQVLKHCTLMYTYDQDELDELIHKLENRIEAKSKKTNQIKQAK